MANVARHGSTHRFRFVGGTDPLNVELPGAYAVDSNTNAITDDTEWEWDTITTNNDECYRWDPTDPAGILIQTAGVYAAFVQVDVGSGDAAVDRNIALALGPVSSPGTPSDIFGLDFFYAGKTAVDSASVLPTVQEPTTHMWFAGVVGIPFPDPEDPARVSLWIVHMGSNFSTTNIRVNIWRLSTVDGFGAPMRWEATP